MQGAPSTAYMLTAPVGFADGESAGFGESAAEGVDGAAADADAAGAGAGGAAVGVGFEVGTVTVGIGPAEVGADDGLAASLGTGADAINAVPAPYSYTSSPPRWPV